MLKFKMSLLLNNVKFRVAMVVLLLTAIVTGIFFIPKNKAGNVSQSVNVMANSSGATVGGSTIYKIEKEGNVIGYDNLFCIQEGADLVYHTYSNPIDIVNADSYFSNYNSAMWLINNMYLSTTTGKDGLSDVVAKDVEAMNFANLLSTEEVKDAVNNSVGVDYSGVTAHKIYQLRNRNIGSRRPHNSLDLMGQIVLWNYTKNVNSPILSKYAASPNQFFEGTDLSNDEQITLKYVYYALKYLADKNAGATTGTIIPGYVTLDKSNAKFDTTNYLVGPYYIKINNMNITSYELGETADIPNAAYPARATVTNVDDSKTELNSSVFEKRDDGSFYINLANNKNAKSVSFTIDYVTATISTTGYVLDGGSNQHLMALEKQVGATSLMDTKEVENKGNYSVELVKVAEDGTTVITTSEAEFSVNGNTKTTTSGVLMVENSKKITDVNAIDSYEISETKAPEGYVAFDGTLKLDVGFKLEGITYLIDDSKVNISGVTENVSVIVSPDKTKVTVYIPNKFEPGEFNLELIKVNEKGEIIQTPAKFEINGEEKETVNGVIEIAKGVKVESEDEENTYTIKETGAPEHYDLFDGTIYVKVIMTKTETGFVLNEDGISMGIDGNSTGAKIKLNGNTVQIYVPNTRKKFDMSLRKFISKIDDEEVEVSREPVINKKSIEMLKETNTASYYHEKNSLEVKEGSLVEYTIRVYNEGEIEGFAKQIVDFLPFGLTFVKLSDDNSSEYTTESSVGARIVTINYSGSTNIKSLREFIGKEEINVTNAYYQEVKLICKVVKSDVKYITSRAEITDYGYYDKDENNNSVWKNAIALKNVDIDSVQNTIMLNLNLDTWYEKAEERTYLDENLETVVDKGYYPGEQDDDDFETVEIKKDFDLSLRKFITEVNGTALTNSRVPQVDVSKLVSGESTTATYNHPKDAVDVKSSDIVTYTIRVYNEGELNGYATKVMDDIPEGLEFVKDSKINSDYKWKLYKEMGNIEITIPESTILYNGKTYVITDNVKEADVIVTDYLSRENSTDNLLKAFDINTMETLDYKDVKVEFKVIEPNTSDRIIINYAQITDDSDSEGNPVTDRDSTPNEWIENEDDQDIEKIKVEEEIIIEEKEFDLSLRKFITEVNGTALTNSRVPQVDVSKLLKNESTTATYKHSKDPVLVKNSDIVTYTIRVYNEGEVNGYATKVMDNIPEGLEFVKDSKLNAKYRWVMYTEVGKDGSNGLATITYNNKTYVVTDDVTKADLIVTDYLSKANGINNLLKAFDPNTMGTLDFKDVKVEFKVIEPNSSDKIITNHAQISDDSDEEGNPVTDRDSTPNKWIENEDDQDIEKIKLEEVVEEKEFDLSLRKFITEINGKKLAESREPQVDVSKLVSGESTTATYNHSKNPVEVNNTDIVTYTIRVYNEGEVNGYATKVMDDIPEGLEFVPAKYDENGKAININAKYKWTLYRLLKDGEKASEEATIVYNNKTYVITDNVKEADVIVTDYLAKENGVDNELEAFDSNTMTTLDYRDVKVDFKVIEPKTSDRIIINYAQITEESDSEGNPVTDRDSTPNEWIEKDDDQDIEKIKVRYFDLSLLKWVSKAIVYENGEKTVTETGHTGYERPEPVVKVDLKNTSLDNVEVKFEYTIRVINEGEIAGYAKEVSDYIPEGLKFVAADNEDWREVDGKIVTRALENTLLQPGEHADVTVILTWINGKDNLGLKVNTAEISEDYNEYNTPDIDSTPNNRKEDEDDIDTAPVILTVRTGKAGAFFGITIIALSIVTAGVVVIKKKVLDV